LEGSEGNVAKNKEVDWVPWILYSVGRALQIFGMLAVTLAMVNFFGTNEMRTMLGITGVGAAFFVVGWLLSKDDPAKKR
jgi:hypothetical protein